VRIGFRYSVGVYFLERKRHERHPPDTGGFSGIAYQRGPGCSHVAIFPMIIEDLQHKYEGLKQRITLVRSYL
jgi:hypothetical protein